MSNQKKSTKKVVSDENQREKDEMNELKKLYTFLYLEIQLL